MCCFPPLPQPLPAHAHAQETIRNVLPAVVVIKSASTRGFDGEGAVGGEATGFIVDLEQGLILTNRHVVTLGPIVASLSFYNKEEVRRGGGGGRPAVGVGVVVGCRVCVCTLKVSLCVRV
jgi:S1-C subfamily serine protease